MASPNQEDAKELNFRVFCFVFAYKVGTMMLTPEQLSCGGQAELQDWRGPRGRLSSDQKQKKQLCSRRLKSYSQYWLLTHLTSGRIQSSSW